jgi:hypothetical protein
MSLKLSSSFERSLSIFRKLQNEKIDNSKRWESSLWINGREEGISLTNYEDGNKIIFTEARNSDAIVIYYGKQDDFEGYFEMITEETYKRGIYLYDDEEVFQKILFLMKIENWI